MVTVVERREILAGALKDAVSRLEQAFVQEGKGKQVGLFLQHEITHEADEITLARILQAVKQEIAAAERGLETQVRW